LHHWRMGVVGHLCELKPRILSDSKYS
jgi:hypothetical protein